MSIIRLRDIPGYEEFKSICKFFICEEEYPGWTGTEKAAVITELSEEELVIRFPKIMEELSPFLLMTPKHGEVIQESHRNNNKFKMRGIRSESSFGFDEDTSECHEEATEENFEENLLISLLLQEGLAVLTQTQRQRVSDHYLHYMSFREIAELQSADPSSIRESVIAGIEKMRKHFA